MSVIGSNILAGASGQGGYFLTNSLRFRSSASAYLNRTPASASNQQTWTLSMWMKRGSSIGTSFSNIFSARTGSSGTYTIAQFASDVIQFVDNGGMALYTTQVFRDPSAWYHFVFSVDTTQSTSSNRVKLYVNGSQITSFTTATYPSLNANLNVNSTATQLFGQNASSQYADYYLAEVNFVDGQALTPSSFGATSSATGVWQPIKYTGTYGTNGFYLPFTDNSALTTSSNAGLGKDFSGNGNYWTTNNISITSGATYDSMTDVPTLTSPTAANYCVLNPLKNALTLSAANLNWVGISSGSKNAFSSIGVTSGKWYFEAYLTNTSVSGNWGIGLCNDPNASNTSILGNTVNGWVLYTGGGGANLRKYNNSVDVQIYSAANSIGATIGVAFDVDTGKIWFSRNNVWLEGDPSSGTTPSYSNLTGTVQVFAYGYDSNDQGSINFGQRPFSYTPPAGFLTLNTTNLPTPTIGATASSQANKYFDVTTYTGTGSSLTVTNSGSMQPDWVWIKSRSVSSRNTIFDAVRGANKVLWSDSTDAEGTANAGTGLTAFASNGFTLGTEIAGTSGSTNTNGTTYVGWQWRASNATAVTNTAGSITSTVSANTTAGFSIVTYTGNGTNPSTVGHGLGVAPSFIIVKNRNSALYDWNCYHISLGNTQYIALNTTAAASSAVSLWNNTTPTSSVFTVNHAAVNTSSNTLVAYCFAQVSGYSAFGSYTGNGSTDGTFVYTGFRPKWIMIKRSSGIEDWRVFDTSRSTYNIQGATLYPNTNGAENSGQLIDINSNGFKCRTTDVAVNGSGSTYIYAAFAETPFKYANAR